MFKYMYIIFQCESYMCVYISSIQSLSHVQLFATPWNVAHQDPLSMGFPRQEYWSGLPFSSPGDLPEPRIEPMSLALAGGANEPPRKPLKKNRDII